MQRRSFLGGILALLAWPFAPRTEAKQVVAMPFTNPTVDGDKFKHVWNAEKGTAALFPDAPDCWILFGERGWMPTCQRCLRKDDIFVTETGGTMFVATSESGPDGAVRYTDFMAARLEKWRESGVLCLPKSFAAPEEGPCRDCKCMVKSGDNLAIRVGNATRDGWERPTIWWKE